MSIDRTLRKWLLLPFAWRHVVMPGRSARFDLTDPTEQETLIEANLRVHVEKLAVQIGERNAKSPDALAAARTYIGEQFSRSGHDVVEHHFPDGINLIAYRRPAQPRVLRLSDLLPDDSSLSDSLRSNSHHDGDLIIGAHYDTVPGSPGANDNASGIAVLLELARLLDSPRIRFAAFDNEEHIGQPATQQGSYCYAKECFERGDEIRGMWSLETVGYFSAKPHSQRYPAPFDLFYPTVGNFVAFVGNDASRDWVRHNVGAFRSVGVFPCEGVAAPNKFADINRSDQWGFWQFGYPALMVTDTANFRYDAYHTPADTPEKCNYDAMARLTRVLYETLRKLI